MNHLVYNDKPSVIDKFKNEAHKIFNKRSDYNNLKKYYDFLIEYQIKQINREIGHGDDSDQKENNMFPGMKVVIPPLDAKFLAEKQCNIVHTKSKKDLIKNFPNYELSNMLRAHSKDNNMNDAESHVSDAAFELADFTDSIDSLPNYTNLVATCGNNIINLIDTESGKIVKRFVDDMAQNRVKEVNIAVFFGCFSVF